MGEPTEAEADSFDSVYGVVDCLGGFVRYARLVPVGDFFELVSEGTS